MPITECMLNGQPGFKWGEEGHCYTYSPGDERSKEAARGKAAEQGRAIQANEGKIFKQKRIYVPELPRPRRK